jgi:anti-sigma B factor antagonist
MSNLTITKRQREGVVIVDLEGKIAIGETNRQLHEAVHVLVQENQKNVVLNLTKVSGIDSIGLGELIAGYATLEKNG